MKTKFRLFLVTVALLFAGTVSFAQNKVTAVLKDSSTGEPVSFATVSLTQQGATKPAYYVLSSESGAVNFDSVKKGTYTIKVELMSYKTYTQEVKVENAPLDLKEIKISPDSEVIKAASVSAVGNPIIMKRDTIEFSASTYKITENDALEDLLKKLPGVEVDEDGSVTVNGETISKITIDGKTFFLDDPQLATKNIPAKIIEKVKVIEKKSDQAEFTGIDDGEEEHVIDLSVKRGMMKGLFGNVMGGGGHDIPTEKSAYDDFRYQGAGFIGRFTDKSQVSIVLNANNTNNRGFNDLSGSMMGNMRGGGGGFGGGGSGITRSFMGGLNGAWSLFDNKMNLGGNYLYNNSKRDILEESSKLTHLDAYDLDYNTNGTSVSNSQGHRFGVRLEHKFSDNTSILFQPQVNFGTGNFLEESTDTTYKNIGNESSLLNNSRGVTAGSNKNVNTYGFFLFRQRLGIPGRTLTANARYSISNNDLRGLNSSRTSSFDTGEQKDSIINQIYDSNRKSVSLTGRVTYTEPLGGNFYVEGNYEYSWTHSKSYKDTYDVSSDYGKDNYRKFDTKGQIKNIIYSNSILNEYVNQTIGANLLYQKEKSRFQVGVSLKPTKTHNETEKKGTVQSYDSKVLNWSPQAMAYWEFNEMSNIRFFYNGRSNQPSNSQLMPVPDNTDPLNVSFGNPTLKPYFNHGLRGEYRYNNKKTYATFNIRFNGNYTKNPIVNAMWYGNNGAQYSMPFNGPDKGNAGFNCFLNVPLGGSSKKSDDTAVASAGTPAGGPGAPMGGASAQKSPFTISNMLNFNWSLSNSFVTSTIDMSEYYSGGEMDYDKFIKDYNDGVVRFDTNKTQSISATERFRVRYRTDNLELGLSARTRYSHTWYSIANRSTTNTFNNQISASVNWTWEAPGLTFKSDFSFNWYRGYTTPQDNQYLLNAEIQKYLFKKKCTLALKGYDLLGQSRTLRVTDTDNYHKETHNNTLGRYLILSLTYRFGNFNGAGMGRGGYGPGRR